MRGAGLRVAGGSFMPAARHGRAPMDRLPLFPLHAVLFPGASLPLRVFEPRYHALLRDIGPGGRFGVVLIRSGSEVGPAPDPFAVGTSARVEAVLEQGPVAFLSTRGEERFRIERLVEGKPYLQADVTWLGPPPAEGHAHAHLHAEPGHGHAHLPIELEVAALFGDYLRLLGLLTRTPPDDDVAALLAGQRRADAWATACAVGHALLVPPEEKQPVLEAASVHDALHAEHALLAREVARLQALARTIAAGQN
jgi:Lon protease-like protein